LTPHAITAAAIDQTHGAAIQRGEPLHGHDVRQRNESVDPCGAGGTCGAGLKCVDGGCTPDEKPVFTAGVAPDGPVECVVQVRAHGGIADAVAGLRSGELVADLRAPLTGVAPGQTMVLYRPDADGDEVIGSATIAHAK